ncbi:MAG: M20/M25/M40 family metallo-hydrolase [Alphaproteobacteria bacterium]|nr:M20/M25/M40 family metallo-hydrolase [Alphaproteobacteria bacterium]
MRAVVLALLAAGCVKTGLPGRSHRGALPAADDALAESTARIGAHVHALAADIGRRSPVTSAKGLDRAEDYVADALTAQGWEVVRQPVEKSHDNLIATLPGSDGSLAPVVVGAHYDTAAYTPGADDNASGVASLLEIARAMRDDRPLRTVIFVAWTHEEPPNFATPFMGSVAHAQSVGEVHAALSIETIGMYSDARGSQHYPFPFSVLYPNRGDFIGFITNTRSRRLLSRVGRTFRTTEPFPSRGAAGPRWITGLDWSDHRSYWSIGAPALMVTDTALFRNPHYHEPSDTEEVVDPERIARVTRGLVAVVRDLASD